MIVRGLRIALWAALCGSVVWGALTFRSDAPRIFSYSLAHVLIIGLLVMALIVGTRAFFGAPTRRWDVVFLGTAVLGAAIFSVKNIVLRGDVSFGDFVVLVLAATAYFRLKREQVSAALNVSVKQAASVVLVNCLVLAGLALACEGVARVFLSANDPAYARDTKYGNPFWFQFQPYLMFSMDSNVDIRFKNGRLPGDIEEGQLKTNNMGFRMAEPVDFDLRRPKASGERVVLFTGGSAAWGAGATANDKTIAARLEAILNESQQRYRYVVVSLSSGGWIAMQSMLALTIYGPNFDPDWIVTMDGNNDIVAACTEGLGAGRDGYSHVFDQYFKSYLHHQPQPPFYRGAWENELIRVSSLYRVLTQRRYVPAPDKPDAGWGEVERSLKFYELAYDRLYRTVASSKVKVLMSSQPYKNIFRKDFDAVPASLRDLERRYHDTPCARVPHLELMKYFHPRLRQVSQQLVSEWKDRIDLRYLDMTDLMPEDVGVRLDFSWGGSPVHLSDRGQDFVARIYAKTILDADSPR